MKNIIKVALVGNPNVGKTSVFNALTGLNQRVGNYPGITVERKAGSFKINEETLAQVIDLPGTYSINASSQCIYPKIRSEITPEKVLGNPKLELSYQLLILSLLTCPIHLIVQKCN